MPAIQGFGSAGSARAKTALGGIAITDFEFEEAAWKMIRRFFFFTETLGYTIPRSTHQACY